MKTSILHSMVVILLSAVAVIADDLADAAREAEKLSREYSKLEPWQRAPQFDSRISSVDCSVAQAIQGILGQFPSAESQPTSTTPSVIFRQYPTNVTQIKRIRFQFARDKAVIVNLRSKNFDDERILYVFENSFWNERRYEWRINPSMHVLLSARGKKSVMWQLVEPYSGSIRLRFAETPPCFLGFVANQPEGLPGIAVLYGPAGTGLFAKVFIFSYNSDRDAWQSRNVLEFAGSPMFEYDEKTSTIQYQENHYEEQKREVIATRHASEGVHETSMFSGVFENAANF